MAAAHLHQAHKESLVTKVIKELKATPESMRKRVLEQKFQAECRSLAQAE
jgi:hypothetical protein